MDAIKITHYKDEFLSFYHDASQHSFNENDRFSAWKKYYGFNPYMKEDPKEQLAREMLEQAFPKYERALPTIESFQVDEEEIFQYISLIRESLNAFEPMQLSIVFFIGDFETDPFIEKEPNDAYTLYFPIEIEWKPILLVNELAKTVYLNQSKLNPRSLNDVAHVVYLEGLALHTADWVTPKDYLSLNIYPWLSKCSREPTRIMMNLLPHLRRSDYKAIYSFTKGTGASGYTNEASFVGWRTIKHMLEKGNSLASLLNIPEEQILKIVEQTLYQVMEEAKYIRSNE
ncbi:hypothetical protein [Halobacillus campisalis]|uniref:Uncharacterized protein n=1 Tax=Halobacillus campisalis TaxID=435909 RepID=A0ABW2K1Y8_9BACI|nr:hypothetical protein [Halobacillus campisalis]